MRNANFSVQCDTRIRAVLFWINSVSVRKKKQYHQSATLLTIYQYQVEVLDISIFFFLDSLNKKNLKLDHVYIKNFVLDKFDNLNEFKSFDNIKKLFINKVK